LAKNQVLLRLAYPMTNRGHLQLVSTFDGALIAPSLSRSLAAAGVAADVGFARFTQLSEYLLASPPDSADIVGTAVLLRLEDWLRERLQSTLYDPANEPSIRQELRSRVEEFVSQFGILAHSGKPVWFLACPSNGWVSEHHKLTGLCRTYTNLVAARVRDLPNVAVLNLPTTLSAADSVDRNADHLSHAPFTQDAFHQLADFLGSEIVRRLATLDPSAASSTTSGSSELAEYLIKLSVRVEVSPATRNHREHVGHILQTAASFSLTGETPDISDAEVDALLESRICVLVKVADRVSDYGFSGVAVARTADNTLVVESMALSCPILGKQVEFAVLSALAQIANQRHLGQIIFEFHPSGRNQPMLAFLKATADEQADGSYGLRVGDAEARIKTAAVAAGAWTLEVSLGGSAA
jgi:hypothetical protein